MTPDHSPDAHSDEELAARRDVSTLYERYGRRLLSFLATLGVAERDLDDVHQTIWIRVLRALEASRFKGHFRGWLFQVARNLVIDLGRVRREVSTLPGDAPIPTRESSPLEGLIHQEEHHTLARCLEELEPREAQVFTLRVAGADYDEVCRQLGLERRDAYRLSHEATKKLTSCVERSNR